MRIKSFLTSCLFLATLLVSNQKLSAYEWSSPWDSNPCCTPNYDTCCAPACCDNSGWSVTVYGGVQPSWFLRREPTEFHFRPADALAGVGFFRGREPRFNDLWDHPWNVGIEIGYFYCCDWRSILRLHLCTSRRKMPWFRFRWPGCIWIRSPRTRIPFL